MEPKSIKQEKELSTKDESTEEDDFRASNLGSKNPEARNRTKVSTNDSYSPHNIVNGTPSSCPSPPALTTSSTTVLFPPHPTTLDLQQAISGPMVASGGTGTVPVTPAVTAACNAPIASMGRDNQRQLNKVRRFLTTVQQFASDITPEVGDRVRSLILSLLGGAVTVEDFHCALQDVTHFPLRPFVLPFLRSHLPLLTRELHSMARRASMPIAQYVSMQESNLLDAAAGEPLDFFSAEISTGKRRHESCFENGDASIQCPTNTSGSSSSSTGAIVNGGFAPLGGVASLGSGGGISPPPSKKAAIMSPPYPILGVSPELSYSGGMRDFRSIPAPDDEWKNIHVMLACILSMVEKTRRALTILQQREDRDSTCSTRGTPASGTAEGRYRTDYDNDVRRHASELVSQAIRSTEERVAEVKRKAEESISEVKRAAMVDVQRAVSAAETRAQELVVADRNRIENLLREAARRESVGEQKVDPKQACWNCGRKAADTCSGCSVAKYCCPFCQHKDWDNHHKICSPTLAATTNPSTMVTTPKSSCKIHNKPPEVAKAE